MNELNPMNYVSVSHEFLQSINPNWNIDTNRNHLLAALRAAGVNISKRVDQMEDMWIRYPHAPMFSRKTTIYQGRLLENYPFASMYKGCEILDINLKNDNNIQTVINFLNEMDINKKKVSDFDFVEESNYDGKEGIRDLKNQYVSKEQKKRYKIMNKNDEQLDILLQQENLFESPFDDFEDEGEEQ